MRTVRVYEKKDLDKFEDQLYYFLQGDNGFYRRNDLRVGSYNPKDTETSYLLTITDAINDAPDGELKLLKQHIDNRLNFSENELERAKKKVEDHLADIHKYTQLQNMVRNYPTFREAFEDIAS